MTLVAPAVEHPPTFIAPASRTLLLSVHPRFADLIIAGAKTVELRRRFHAGANQFALLYSTVPVAAVIGSVRIIRVDQLPISDIWRLHGRDAAVTPAEFSNYFSGRDAGCALHLADPRRYKFPIPLAELRSQYGLDAPQSHVMLNEAHRALIHHEHG